MGDVSGQIPVFQQAKTTINLCNQAIQGVQQLRCTVTNVFQLLSDGFENVDKEMLDAQSTPKSIFLQRLQDLLHSVNKDFTELEKLGNGLNSNLNETALLGHSGQLCLDPSGDDQTLYHNLILTYHWQTKLHLYGQYTNFYLNQSGFKRSTTNYRRRRMPSIPTPQNKLYTKSPPQALDGFVVALIRQFQDLQMKGTPLYNSTKIVQFSVDRIFIGYLLLKGLLIEKIVIFGLDENVAIDRNRQEIFTASRYECMRRITDNATCAYLSYECLGSQPDLPIKHLLSWILSFKSLFTDQCKKCGRILDKGVPPTWHEYKQPHFPYHDNCKP